MSNPQLRGQRTTKHIVARVDEIPDGARFLTTAGGREIGIFNVKGEYYAVLNRCPHLGGPLCRGQLLNSVLSSCPGDVRLDTTKDLITCPWHGWEFDLRTGQSYWNPEHLRARKFPVGVEAGAALAIFLEQGESNERIPGPYRAETLPVSIEAEYVVVTMRNHQQPSRGYGSTSGSGAAPIGAPGIEKGIR